MYMYDRQPNLCQRSAVDSEAMGEDYNHDSDVIGLAQTPLITAHTLH